MRERERACVESEMEKDTRSLAVSLFRSRLLLAVFFLGSDIKIGAFPFKYLPLDSDLSAQMRNPKCSV